MRFRVRTVLAVFVWLAAFVPFGSEALGGRVDLKLGINNGTRTIVFTPDSGNPARAVVFLAGSSGVGRREFRSAENFAKRGILTVVPYYLERYSEGLKIEYTRYLREDDDKRETVEADLLMIMDQVSERFSVSRSDFSAQGFSIGGAFVRDMAARSQIRAGVIISGAWLNGEDDEKHLRSIVSGKSSPLLIFAGTNDELINFNSPISPKHVEAIFREAGAPVEAHYFKGGDHSLRSYGSEMRPFLRAFYSKLAPKAPGSGSASPGASAGDSKTGGSKGRTAR